MAYVTSHLTTHRIVSSTDPKWQEWKAIYDSSFPPNEKMSDNFFVEIFQNGDTNQHILAVTLLDIDEVVAIGHFEVATEFKAAYLWYIATQSEQRSQGIGRLLYHEICKQIASEGGEVMFIEVEIPSLCHTPEESLLATRRINWYLRQGAKLIQGIKYEQTVDSGFPPTEMWLMAHPLIPLEAKDIHHRCSEMFDTMTLVDDFNLHDSL
jgi:GNAT superfamily N-acetyltransferase